MNPNKQIVLRYNIYNSTSYESQIDQKEYRIWTMYPTSYQRYALKKHVVGSDAPIQIFKRFKTMSFDFKSLPIKRTMNDPKSKLFQKISKAILDTGFKPQISKF